MDFGLSRREESSSSRRETLSVITKTRKSSILNETDVILASGDQPGHAACYSSPNSTNVADIHFDVTHNLRSSGSGGKKMHTSFGRDDSQIEAKIKANEAYLAQLRSIDLKKYSFPNENKPKTDYTYAKTTSYMSSSQTENCVMPNLCRRSRISPPVKPPLINLNPFSSNSLPNHTTTTNTLNTTTDHLSQKSTKRLSYFQNIRSYLGNSNTKPITSNSESMQFTDFKQPMQPPGMAYSTSSAAPRLNIGQFLNETEHQKTTNFSQNNIQKTPKKKSSGCWTVFWLLLLAIVMTPFILFGMQRLEAGKEFNLDRGLLNDFQAFMHSEIVDKCPIVKNCRYVWKEARSLSRDLAAKSVKNADSILKEGRITVGNKWKDTSDLIAETWRVYWPQSCQKVHQIFTSCIENIAFVYEFIKETATSTTTNIVNTVEYKLPNFRGNDDTETDADKKEMIKNYHLLKEKIYKETMEMVKTKSISTAADVQTIQDELDQKFNFTLTSIANKMIDQSMQFELSKQMHEKELSQMKLVLVELETRYSQSMEQLQEKLASQTSKLEANQNKMNMMDPEVRESIMLLMKSASDEISYEKIEAYINKTFYLYNADKTGMTDFASEMVGGSILFTRCTEVFADNSRWFMIFDFPITRLTVSPRVVIQGTVQPGNCWAFKGSKGDLFIKLAAKITPSSFSLEHIPKELSLTGIIDSAPQNFTVYGYTNKEDISDSNRLILGNFRYDNNSKSTLQFFDVQFTYEDKAIQVIELKIESNSGHKELTCLYKFRVHGKLFEQIQREKLEKVDEELEKETTQGQAKLNEGEE